MEEFVYETLLNPLSLSGTDSSTSAATTTTTTTTTTTSINVVDIANKFNLNIQESKRKLYDYYNVNKSKYSGKLNFHIMCIYNTTIQYTLEKDLQREVQETIFKIFNIDDDDDGDYKKLLNEIPKDNILDVFVYDVCLNQVGGDSGIDRSLVLKKLGMVNKVFVTHGLVEDIGKETKKSVREEKEAVTVPQKRRSVTEPLPTTTPTTTTTTTTTPTTTTNTAENSNSSTPKQVKKSSFMGLRSMEFLKKRKEQDDIKERERLKSLREIRGSTTTFVEKKMKKINNTQNSAKLKELESMFSDDDDDIKEEEEAKEEEQMVENKPEETVHNNLAQVEDLFDTTNEDSVLHTQPLPSSPVATQREEAISGSGSSSSTHVDKDGFIVTTKKPSSTKPSVASKRPAKRTAKTMPLVNSKTPSQKKQKQGNLMEFFGKKKS